MYQQWLDLLFLHWEVDAERIQRTLPEGLYVDCHQDRAYLGVVPFKMRNVRPRFLPTAPLLSNFLELNLRTYVHDKHGTPGVWFYSLDAYQRVAVFLAQRVFHLPYHWARMHCATNPQNSEMTYTSDRGGDPAKQDQYRYRPTGKERLAQPGTLEFFLLERYVLFSQSPSGIMSGRVHHAPYAFCDVQLEEWTERLFTLNGFEAPGCAPVHAAFSPGVDVSIYGLQRG